MISNFAPIILFVFARPEHTLRTLEALVANDLADQSDLIVYSDAPRNDDESVPVNKVRTIVHSATGFRSTTIIERKVNYGLAKNIIEGVNETCKRYDRVIVLEDDIVTHPQFLTFMNQALSKYANDWRVWHISGWNYPMDPEGIGDAFFWRLMNCWGWATWSDRWQNYQKNPQRLIHEWTKNDIHSFNLDGGSNFWKQITANQSGKLNSWAIFWYATIFEHKGLCLNPTHTFTRNIGLDGSGENCGANTFFSSNSFCNHSDVIFPDDIEESALAIEQARLFYKRIHGFSFSRVKSFFTRIFSHG